jgi:hypothetical protein
MLHKAAQLPESSDPIAAKRIEGLPQTGESRNSRNWSCPDIIRFMNYDAARNPRRLQESVHLCLDKSIHIKNAILNLANNMSFRLIQHHPRRKA